MTIRGLVDTDTGAAVDPDERYVQPGDLATVATSGAYADLTGQPAIPSTPEDIGAAAAGGTAGSSLLAAETPAEVAVVLEQDPLLFRFANNLQSAGRVTTGSDWPIDPQIGDLHTRTDRSSGVVYLWDGSAWRAMAALGDVDLYCCALGDGNPWNPNGGALTPEDALAAIPSIVRGNIKITVKYCPDGYAGDIRLANIPIPVGARRIIQGAPETVVDTTATANGTALSLVALSQKASIQVAATLVASAHKDQFVLIGDNLYPIWDNTTDTITIAGAWDRSAWDIAAHVAVNPAIPVSGTPLKIVKMPQIILGGTLEFNGQWILSCFDTSQTSLPWFFGIDATFGGLRSKGLTLQSGTGSLTACALSETATSARGLYIRQGASVSVSQCCVRGGANGAVDVSENATCAISGSTIQQTVGTAATSLMVRDGAQVFMAGSANLGTDIFAPSDGGVALTVKNGAGVYNGFIYNNRIQSSSVSAATFALAVN